MDDKILLKRMQNIVKETRKALVREVALVVFKREHSAMSSDATRQEYLESAIDAIRKQIPRIMLRLGKGGLLCPKCEAVVSSKTCSNCGQYIIGGTSKSCPSCKSMVIPNYCLNCGQRLKY